jgi:U5 snRNP spliceosome subunit
MSRKQPNPPPSEPRPSPPPPPPKPVTLFMCGPSKCAHDYSTQWVEFEGGGTAVCSKCGARSIDEAVWD